MAAYDDGEHLWVGAVADGVGGRHFGDVASRVAVQEVQRVLEEDPKAALSRVFRHVSEKIIEEERRHPNLATTLTVVRIDEGVADVAHVGDCRAYHLRGFGIMMLTEDQTEAQFLLKQGILDKQTARRYPRRNVLTSALTGEDEYDLYENRRPVESGDRIVLMSDGAYTRVHMREIAEISARTANLSEFFLAVSDLLDARGVRDDASFLCVQV